MSLVGIVSVDVGGVTHRTSLLTLTKHPNCMLATLVDSKWDTDTSKPIFIDRDGNIFTLVLNYLRDDSAAVLPDDKFTLRRLEQEAGYFILPELQKMCNEKLAAMSESESKIENTPVTGEERIIAQLLQAPPATLNVILSARKDILETLLKQGVFDVQAMAEAVAN